MSSLQFDNISVDEISPGFCREKDIAVSVLRLDKIHPVISGNKWFKLKYYIADALALGKKTIATFGGAWSNHIVATAAACNENNIGSIGIIRGEEAASLSPTLLMAQSLGMKLYFTSRSDYQKKNIPDALSDSAKNIYFINEGGYGIKGAEGAATIAGLFSAKQYTHICCAVGTGTMMAGLIKSSTLSQEVIGISVLKNNHEQQAETINLLTNDEKLKKFFINHEYHFGGYAKYTQDLIDFMNDFYKTTGIPSDFVYTGKLFYAVNDLIRTNFFPSGSRILMIHSGGLQGNQSLKPGMLIF